MQLRQIKYFVAVAEEGNLTAAAHRLHISQPPITRQIQQLEDELGVQLFMRTRKGMKITDAGEAFLGEARQILSHVRLASDRSQAAARGEIGKLEVGHFGSCIYSVLPRLVREFYAQNRLATVALTTMTKREQVDALRDGRIHIGFGRYYAREEGFTVAAVETEQLVVALPDSHHLASRKSVKISDLVRESFIVFPKGGRPSFADEVVRLFRNKEFEPRVEHEAHDLSSAIALVAVGAGICPVPASVAGLGWPNVKFVAMANTNVQTEVACIFSAENQSPVLVRFLESIGVSF